MAHGQALQDFKALRVTGKANPASSGAAAHSRAAQNRLP